VLLSKALRGGTLAVFLAERHMSEKQGGATMKISGIPDDSGAQAGIPGGGGGQQITKVTAERVAWWLSVGEAEPTLANRFMHGRPDDAERRVHIAAQVNRIIEAAEVAGFGNALVSVLAELLDEQSLGAKSAPTASST
jgi:hypothetical protein